MRLVVGDIHGCNRTLRRLLADAGWSAGRDELWCVGDLVNKGTGSLEVLRWMARRSSCVRIVLGNHDLHLLRLAAGLGGAGRSDRLAGVLGAPDRRSLLDWLRAQPLLHCEPGWMMVHAGLWPGWSRCEVADLARRAGRVLQGPGWTRLLAAGASPDLGTLAGASRTAGVANEAAAEHGVVSPLAAAMAVMTQVRVVHPEGNADLGFTGAPVEAPAGHRPWYEVSAVPGEDQTVLFGHWARLGSRRTPGAWCLDAGCVYGGELHGVWLETGELVRTPVVRGDCGRAVLERPG